jgi:SAM-dependent methyltransferase
MSADYRTFIEQVPQTKRYLLLGAGNKRQKVLQSPGSPEKEFVGELVTLDIDPDTKPDVLHDLNVLPLPFADNEFDEIHAYEVMEHCGRQGDWQFFFAQFAEIWRILKPGGLFCATVPAWDSMWAWGDPGHTRLINEGSLVFLSQPEYAKQIGRTSMTDYRGTWQHDFDICASGTDRDTFAFVIAAVKPSRWALTKS